MSVKTSLTTVLTGSFLYVNKQIHLTVNVKKKLQWVHGVQWNTDIAMWKFPPKLVFWCVISLLLQLTLCFITIYSGTCLNRQDFMAPTISNTIRTDLYNPATCWSSTAFHSPIDAGLYRLHCIKLILTEALLWPKIAIYYVHVVSVLHYTYIIHLWCMWSDYWAINVCTYINLLFIVLYIL